MFQNWGFLLTEIWVLIALAGLVGLIAGYIIWGTRKPQVSRSVTHAPADIIDRDRQIAALKSAVNDREEAIQKLNADLSACLASKVAAPSAPAAAQPKKQTAPADTKTAKPAEAAAPKAPAASAPVAPAPSGQPQRPKGLSGPRNGKPDDLKRIKGVGPQLAKLCHDLGFYHFDQIAAWTPAEVAWVDDNLTGFVGRVSRDDWISQAKLLAAGGETEFSKKVDKGDMY